MPQPLHAHLTDDDDGGGAEELLDPGTRERGPRITRRDSSTTIWLVPEMPLPRVEAPATPPVGQETTRTSIPFVMAAAAITAMPSASNVARTSSPQRAPAP